MFTQINAVRVLRSNVNLQNPPVSAGLAPPGTGEITVGSQKFPAVSHALVLSPHFVANLPVRAAKTP